MIRSLKIVCVLILFSSFYSFGQGRQAYDNEVYNDYFDSLKNMEYNKFLPILGDKVYKRGYDIQYGYGISAVYFTQTQEIDIQRTLLGFNNSELVDMSDFIVFAPTVATTNAYTVRPDIWILPFLNVYAIIGGGTTQTDVTLIEPIGIQTSQRFGASSFGLGVTLVGAVGPVWMAWDNNYNWADVEVVVEPVPAYNGSLRIGHTFFNANNPQKSLAVWAGAFYQIIQSDTEGSIPLQNVFPDIGSGQTIDNLREWASTLPPPQRLIANQIINKLEDISNGIDPDNAIINYKLDKKVAKPMNLIFGAQYQFNKHWILRTELGVFGKRSQFMLNLNYRFTGL
ncbi:hypothetical protein [Marinigracilibium pacificum]|uniref:hypothetical protein n=1 Tax=Marinigracilibium pacificum TaxID=2729599 RepID=UPI00232A78CB|nr:hypothetical protein [Marinigracilibium pacificum]